MNAVATTERRRVRVTGTVQGVGFRPFVYRQAVELGLTGTVCNDSGGVLIEVEGPVEHVAELCRRLVEQPPPLARVESVEGHAVHAEEPHAGFRIMESESEGTPDVPVGVDTAVCADCLAEVDDPTDRRHRYPFTNCTNCGPRYTIVRSVPYDRPATTMQQFTMCADCQREYDDPADRRFHAQPNACPACGPQLRLTTADGSTLATLDGALDGALDLFVRGAVLAVKGLGGFHLACDAANENAVGELRRRKARDDKPFAVMVADLDAAGRLCQLDEAAERALLDARRPIVLAARRADAPVARGVAPRLAELGVMLPYTPLHHLLLAGLGRPIVLTSGNVADEPIVHEDGELIEHIGPLVDAVLTHDRGIHIRCDDSVVRATGRRVQMVRRSRGFAPEPMSLPHPARREVLAVGAELKSTVSVAKGTAIVTSHHLGDLEHLPAYRSFLQAVEHLASLFGITPDVVAHDLHPEYLSTKWAMECGLPLLGVQHHHAHIASCMVEHARTDRVLGLAFDGLGYGCDRALWGGELVAADLTSCERLAHLRPVPLPGGAAAIREPWRMAVAWTHAACGSDAARREGVALDPRADAVLGLVDHGPAASTTSVGRLFDAVAALLDVRGVVAYEGQAAIELEALARTVPRRAAPVYDIEVARPPDAPLVLDPAPMIAEIIEERDAGRSVATIAAGFHEALGRAAAALALELASAHDLDTVALSGGVFQNARLTEVVEDELAAAGLDVLVHERVPPNDGGISIGQAAVAAFADAREPP